MKIPFILIFLLTSFTSAIAQSHASKFNLGIIVENPAAIYPWNFHSQSYFDHPQRQSKPSTVEFHLGFSLKDHQQSMAFGGFLDFNGRATYNTFPAALKFKFNIKNKLSIHPFIQLSIINFISKSSTMMRLSDTVLYGKVAYPVPYCLQLGAFMEYKLSNKLGARGGIYWNQVYNYFFEGDYKTYEDVRKQDRWSLGNPFIALGFGLYYSIGKK
jgi:hypothetical protein